MGEECTSCGADDELLFTCRCCDRQFCTAHQFPHHGCEEFGEASTGGDASDPSEWFSGSDGAEAVGEERPQPVTATPPEPSDRARSLSAGTWQPSANRDGPGLEASDGFVNARPMDSRYVGGAETSAAPRTVGDWVRRQTYFALLVKVGLLALLVNTAFYGGMVATLYGLVPFTL